MIDDAGKEKMRKRLEDFCDAWGIKIEELGPYGKQEMLKCYYLDVIAGELMKIKTPKSIVLPPPPGRN